MQQKWRNRSFSKIIKWFSWCAMWQMFTALLLVEIWIQGLKYFLNTSKYFLDASKYFSEVQIFFIPITLQVVSTRYDGNKTTLKVNGEKYYIHGTQEKLVYDFDDLLIAVGGFLGLFIGLSLNDVMSFLVDLVESLGKRYSV